jgi:ATP-dependent DNA helicase RecQ
LPDTQVVTQGDGKQVRASAFVTEAGLGWRDAPEATAEVPRQLTYLDLTPKDVWLGFGATQGGQMWIEELREGAGLRLRARRGQKGQGWLVCTADGRPIGALLAEGDRKLARRGMTPGGFEFRDGEVQVDRVYHHLQLDDMTGAVTQNWFVAIPQIRVCR